MIEEDASASDSDALGAKSKLALKVNPDGTVEQEDTVRL